MAHTYTKEEIQWLKENRSKYYQSELGEAFNKVFGTSLSSNTLNSTCKRYGITTGRNGQFPKGNVPINKGKKISEYMSEEAIEKMKPTQFKKGIIPPNTLPVGSIVVGKGGYLRIKYSNAPKRKACEKWMSLHKYLYQQYNDVIVPNGYIVIFVDGNIRNFEKDNLRMIKKGANAILNHEYKKTDDVDMRKCQITLAEIKQRIYEVEKNGSKRRSKSKT